MQVVGLFAGIGGIERGFGEALSPGSSPRLLCESWAPAQAVLRDRFPEAELHCDVRNLNSIPAGTDVLTAGFPCQDLSQAGKMAGISGPSSGLVNNVFRLLSNAKGRGATRWVLIENVQNMLCLNGGKAMAHITDELEQLGFRWAYRVVDSRFTGVPQRRRRIILLASRFEDPLPVLFADDAGERPLSDFRDDAFGFYWTEGRGGLGWAEDAVPTLKGGSTVGIPSQPAVWFRNAPISHRFAVPTAEDTEALQGLPRGWTIASQATGKNGPRSKLVGNAVTAPVAAWVASRLACPGQVATSSHPLASGQKWPNAAWGERGIRHSVNVSEYPAHHAYQHLSDLVNYQTAKPLSFRAINGFRNRLKSGNLGRFPGFREDVDRYFEYQLCSSRPGASLVGA